MQGQVLLVLNIRRTPDTTSAPLGKLLPNDIVEATTRTNGWWKLSKITRGSTDIPLPAEDCYAFEGSSNGFIKLLSTEEEKPSLSASASASADVKQDLPASDPSLMPLASFVQWQDQILASKPKMYRIRRWGDPMLDKSVKQIHTSNFQAVGVFNKANNTFGGVSNFLRIPQEDVKYLASLQVEDEYEDKKPDWRKQKMNWLCKSAGTIYFWKEDKGDWQSLREIQWGTIGLGGNLVQVVEVEMLTAKLPNGEKRTLEMARLCGFSKQEKGRPMAELLAEGLVHRCTCAYMPADKFGDSPKGIVYSPFWSPSDWTFIGPKKEQPDALYLPMEWLVKESTDPTP